MFQNQLRNPRNVIGLVYQVIDIELVQNSDKNYQELWKLSSNQ